MCFSSAKCEFVSALIRCDPDRLSSGGGAMRVRDPKDGVIDFIWIGTAAKVCEVDQALRLETVFGHPLERWPKVRPATAGRMQNYGLALLELLHALHSGIAVHDVHALG